MRSLTSRLVIYEQRSVIMFGFRIFQSILSFRIRFYMLSIIGVLMIKGAQKPGSRIFNLEKNSNLNPKINHSFSVAPKEMAQN